MFRRLAQIAMRYIFRPDAQCTLCNVKHSVAKPFVEGPNGFLICRHCVAAAFDQLQRQPNRQVIINNTEAFRHVDASHEANPYAPLPTVPSLEQFCGLCGSEIISPDGHNVICDACVMYSKKLIDEQIANA